MRRGRVFPAHTRTHTHTHSPEQTHGGENEEGKGLPRSHAHTHKHSPEQNRVTNQEIYRLIDINK